jgi:hypothetical protein
MSDEEAYMQLILSNSQSELSALEVGIHARGAAEKELGGKGKKGGLSEYARAIGRSTAYVSQVRAAAEVFASVPQTLKTSKGFREKTYHLTEIYAAPEWLRPALVAKVQTEDWTVESTRKAVQSVKDVPEPPAWTDREKIAAAVESAKLSSQLNGLSNKAQHLSEIHGAPPWLWPALVSALQAEEWTKEVTSKKVQSVKAVPEPPPWTDREHSLAGAAFPSWPPPPPRQDRRRIARDRGRPLKQCGVARGKRQILPLSSSYVDGILRTHKVPQRIAA